MKKTLVAGAVLAFVGAVSAQSTVTLHGSIDTSVGYAKVKSNAAFAGPTIDKGLEVFSGQQNGSRWGMRGTEDLGGGMAAVFALESGFSQDDGSMGQGGLLFGREAYVGLRGGFGQVLIGRQYTPIDGMFAFTGGYAIEAWNKGSATAFGNTGSIAANRIRQNNSLKYVTPSMGGFSGTLMWAPGEDKTAGLGTGRFTSVGLGFANGPVALQFAYETSKAITPATTFVLNPTTGVITAPVAAAAGATVNQWVLGGSYDLGVAKVMATMMRGSQAAVDDKGFALGLSAPMGPVVFDFEYAREKTTNAGAYVSKANAMNLRMNYALSKRTKMYVLLGDGTANKAAAGSKQDLSRFMVGMRHVF